MLSGCCNCDGADLVDPFFPSGCASWLGAQGVLQFLIGRYFNYEANRLVGVNISAPVIQLQVVVTMLLAVVLLRKNSPSFNCGTILAWRIVRNLAAQAVKSAAETEVVDSARKPQFKPRYLPESCAVSAQR